MYFGLPYLFEIEAHANFQVIAAMADTGNEDPDNNDDQQQSSTYKLAKYYQAEMYTRILFRLVLCDTRHIGFCTPITPTSMAFDDGESQDFSYSTQTIDEWFKNVSNSGVLELDAMPIGNHFYSPWLSILMNETKPYEFHLRSSITITLEEASPGTFFVIGHGHLCVPVVAQDNGMAEENVTDLERDWMNSCVWVSIVGKPRLCGVNVTRILFRDSHKHLKCRVRWKWLMQ